jgi:hypothetical protein
LLPDTSVRASALAGASAVRRAAASDPPRPMAAAGARWLVGVAQKSRTCERERGRERVREKEREREREGEREGEGGREGGREKGGVRVCLAVLHRLCVCERERETERERREERDIDMDRWIDRTSEQVSACE